MLSAWILALPSLVLASTATPQDLGSMVMLQRYLGSAISLTTSSAGLTIEYCPDNTCDVFRGAPGTSVENLSDFVFVFLYYESGYVYLNESRAEHPAFREAAKDAVSSIVKRTRYWCKASKPTPKCILRGMAKEYRVSVSASRYDEGGRFESPQEF